MATGGNRDKWSYISVYICISIVGCSLAWPLNISWYLWAMKLKRKKRRRRGGKYGNFMSLFMPWVTDILLVEYKGQFLRGLDRPFKRSDGNTGPFSSSLQSKVMFPLEGGRRHFVISTISTSKTMLERT